MSKIASTKRKKKKSEMTYAKCPFKKKGSLYTIYAIVNLLSRVAIVNLALAPLLRLHLQSIRPLKFSLC